MEATLMVVGISFRTAPVALREAFWIGQSRERHTLDHLSNAEGIEEIALLATCERTEFLIWANDPGLAANSVLRLLSSEYHLQLCQWEHFYRLMDEDALLHIFRVAGGLDSIITGDSQQVAHFSRARERAQEAGGSGKFLNAVLEKALSVSERVRGNPVLDCAAASVASIALGLATQGLGNLEDQTVVLIGAGNLAQQAAACLANKGASSIRILDRTFEHAVQLAHEVNATAVPFEDLSAETAAADVVIYCTGSQERLLSNDQALGIARRRKGQPLCILDLGLPRNVDPELRATPGFLLYDLDDVAKAASHDADQRSGATATAENIAEAEAKNFYRRLTSEHIVPVVVALRSRINELCEQELQLLREERGPFPREQDRMLRELTSRITQAVANSLVHEMKEVPGKAEQDHIVQAVHRLFHLEAEKELVISEPGGH
jgi:glutamyl-tRNA reductase